jgi:LysM repeat protein
VIRTDWPVYTVVRGDTLARIASRYGTTASVLVTANCLSNANYIFAGQQLRVPPSGTVVTPVPGTSYSYNVRISYQTFERGFMVFRSDNGEISVYVGTLSGTVRSFPASTYSRLPDNPIAIPPLPGLYAPVFGFGKVWGNYTDVQANLGWATAQEVGYVTTVTRVGTVFDFTLPNNSRVRVDANRTWVLTNTPLPPVTPLPPTAVPGGPVVTTTPASYQVYDGGFGIWEARTGNVVVFYNNGAYNVYTARQYSSLPDNPVLDPTPLGRVRPAFAFGKVWGNYWDVRVGLGWATTQEQGYVATFKSSSLPGVSQTCFNLPDGRFVTYARSTSGSQSWSYVGPCA